MIIKYIKNNFTCDAERTVLLEINLHYLFIQAIIVCVKEKHG